MEMDKFIDDLSKIKYEWIFLSIILGVISHASRAIRWKILIKTLGHNPSFLNSFFSVMVSYLANLALPRLGEVIRPTVIKTYEKIPYPESFGTIVLERIIDFIVLFILTGLVLLTQYSVVKGFLDANPDVADKFLLIIKILIVIYSAIIVILLVFYFFIRNRIRETKFYIKFKASVLSFLAGMKTILKIKNPFAFIFHTFLIWSMYYLMLYVTFFAFGFTENLGLMTALTTFVVGSYGMVAPVQGGIGAYHFMVIGTLIFYQVDFEDAKLFALINHSSQTLMILLVGSLSLLLLPIYNKQRLKRNKSNGKSL